MPLQESPGPAQPGIPRVLTKVDAKYRIFSSARKFLASAWKRIDPRGGVYNGSYYSSSSSPVELTHVVAPITLKMQCDSPTPSQRIEYRGDLIRTRDDNLINTDDYVADHNAKLT